MCTLEIKGTQRRYHEGNWTCQLRFVSNGNDYWVNASTTAWVKDTTKLEDRFSEYVRKWIKGLMPLANSFSDMIWDLTSSGGQMMMEADFQNQTDEIVNSFFLF